MAIIDTTKKLIDDENSRVFLGIDLPIRKSEGPEGFFASTSTTIDTIKNDLLSLLQTKKGERIFQPNLGLGIDSFLFENITEEMKVDIQNDIIDTIKTFLPFVNIIQLDVLETNANTLNVVCKFSFNNNPNIFETIDFTIGE
jgi:phage baseplate assembly protein W